jgi:hypothetical protein
MADERLINKLKSPHRTLEIMWAHKDTRKELELSGYEHFKAMGDIFIGLVSSGKLEAFGIKKPKEKNVIEDLRFRVSGVEETFYVEEDRGTMGAEKIESKVERYVKLGGRFHVIFCVPDENRAENLLTILAKYRRGNQFLVTLHEYMSSDPLLSIYVSPKDPEKYLSLLELNG